MIFIFLILAKLTNINMIPHFAECPSSAAITHIQPSTIKIQDMITGIIIIQNKSEEL